jgi:Tfp pilus assembly protein PilE
MDIKKIVGCLGVLCCVTTVADASYVKKSRLPVGESTPESRAAMDKFYAERNARVRAEDARLAARNGVSSPRGQGNQNQAPQDRANVDKINEIRADLTAGLDESQLALLRGLTPEESQELGDIVEKIVDKRITSINDKAIMAFRAKHSNFAPIIQHFFTKIKANGYSLGSKIALVGGGAAVLLCAIGVLKFGQQGMLDFARQIGGWVWDHTIGRFRTN